ncbi:hypothetical protein MNBD_ACTINO02-2972 [hydrothermal vent metagenome]|uniref:Uncharacterized protein n=1 Tax=hydrothermal vent metagenome TaxID=652676 RepID=A0A3B0RTS4_9ZZZZ
MTEPLGSDLDLVHAATSDVIHETGPLAWLSVPARTPKRLPQTIVSEDVERLEIVGAQQAERRSSVASDQDTVVLALDPIRDFGQMGHDFRERKCVAHTNTAQARESRDKILEL